MIWARMQCQWKRKNIVFPFRRRRKKSYSHNVFLDVIFHSTIVSGYRKLPQRLHVLLLRWSGIVVRSLKSESENISSREQIFATIARSLKNGRVNIESRKCKVITKLLSRKFTLTPVWRDSRNFWTMKIWSYTVKSLLFVSGLLRSCHWESALSTCLVAAMHSVCSWRTSGWMQMKGCM